MRSTGPLARSAGYKKFKRGNRLAEVQLRGTYTRHKCKKRARVTYRYKPSEHFTRFAQFNVRVDRMQKTILLSSVLNAHLRAPRWGS